MDMDCNFFKSLEFISSTIESEANLIVKYSKAYGNRKKYKNSIFFKSKIITVKKDEIKQFEKKKGIYIFFMKEDFYCKPNFDAGNYSSKRNDKKDSLFEKGKVLYLGKTYNFKERLSQHYSTDDNDGTYSLKLDSDLRRDNKTDNLLSRFCKCVFFELNEEYVKTSDTIRLYEVILPPIEGFLHEKLVPYIGTKRR